MCTAILLKLHILRLYTVANILKQMFRFVSYIDRVTKCSA